MSDEEDQELTEEPEGIWQVFDLSFQFKQVKGYSGMALYNPFEPCLLMLCDTANGWEWKDITDCERKPSTSNIGLAR
jgi:hypothetical protein